MKPTATLRSFLLACGSLLAAYTAYSANLYWDGGIIDLAGNGNTASAGGVGTWNTTIKNWDAGAVPYVTWNNANNDTAVFAGTAATVTLGTGITVGGLSFAHTSGTYTLQTGVLTLAADSIIKATAGGGTASLATMTTADNIFRFQNAVTTNNLANNTVFTVSSAIGGATNSVQILGNGASTAAPIVLSGTLTYGGTTTVADRAALGFSSANVTGLGAGSVSVGQNATIMRSGGSLNNAFLTRLEATTNTIAIISNNAGSGNAIDLSGANGGVNLPNASLAFWDNVGTGSFAFTGAITPGSNGYRFGSSRAGNLINIGAANVLSGNNDLNLIAGSLGNMSINAAQSFSGITTNNGTGRTITLNNNLAIQNSPIDTSGVGTYVLSATTTTPTIGGLIGSKNISGTGGIITTASYANATALTLNPGTGKTHSYSGIISNGAANMTLTKSGAGTQILTGINSYTGATNVTNGILEIGAGGSTHLSSAVTVSDTGSLVVNGTIFGTVFVNSSTSISGTGTVAGNADIRGTHNPGNSPGIQTFSNNLAYTGGASIVNWELTGNTATNAGNPNAIFDQVIVGGNLDFAGATTLNLLFSGVQWANSFWDTSRSWTLYEVSGTTSNFTNLSLATATWLDSTGKAFATDRPGNSFLLSKSGENVILNYNVVPEPSAAMLGGLGALLLLRRRR